MKTQQKDGHSAHSVLIRTIFLKYYGKARQTRLPTGFTLPEIVVTIAIAGILAGMAAPQWLSFQVNQTLKAGQDEAFQAFRQTQAQSIRTRQDWIVSFRNQNGIVQWEMHPTTASSIAPNWQNFSANVQIDPAETTLNQANGVYQMQFDLRGNVYPPLGRITFSHKAGGQARRCVFVSTVLGTIRKSQNQRTADQSGRFCY